MLFPAAWDDTSVPCISPSDVPAHDASQTLLRQPLQKPRPLSLLRQYRPATETGRLSVREIHVGLDFREPRYYLAYCASAGNVLVTGYFAAYPLQCVHIPSL